MRTTKRITLLAFATIILTLMGCGDNAIVTLQSIAVTPASPSISTGLTQQLVATGTYSDGTSLDITASVTWASDTTTVATVNSSGLASGVGAGTAIITATSGAVSGYATLTVTAPVPVDLWTWVSGSELVSQTGVYGTKGTAAPGNVPGARRNASSWIDSSGNLWLFGGQGFDSAGALSYLNDLWKFDGTNWTWVSGSEFISQTGVYGTRGTAASGNVPGARYEAVSWIDSSGNLWLFGGWGYDSAGSIGRLNDLWRYQP